MIAKIYYWLLWHMGFQDKDEDFATASDREKMTFMLRRAQQRAKMVWFILTNLTFAYLSILIYLQKWYIIPVYLFLLWLYIHILFNYAPRGKRK